MTKDETRDTVLNFFKERGQELKENKEYDLYFNTNECGSIVLEPNDFDGWKLSEINLEIRHELIYKILNLPSDYKELIVLLNILNPLPKC